jgi:CMP-N,N'-diacetyllegionaminic acid synthase
MHKLIALIPARVGSKRVPGKNIRVLGGHPLIAYAISSALESKIFDRVIVSTDSELTRKIAIYYGAEAPFLRPAEFATTVSPDIEWIKHAFSQIKESCDAFSILRPTSPFRTARTIKRAWDQFLSIPEIDSLRAVELCKQHPGKMWVIEGNLMRPLLDQSHLEVAWHAGQYQALPKVYSQNSSLEIAWTRVVSQFNSREGKKIAPFLTDETEGFSIDYEYEWSLAEEWAAKNGNILPTVSKGPYSGYEKD